MAAKVSFDDVLNSIRRGNVTVSAGNIIGSGQQRTMRILGEIKKPSDLKDFVVKTQGGIVYLKDIAEVAFKEEDATTYARQKGKSVVMLDVKKRSGKNMVAAAEQIQKIVANAIENEFPTDLEVSITNDQSSKTVNQVDDLVNNIIFGILLVVVVLMFFLGFRNALFVGFAIPMSMFMSFMIISLMGYTLNTMILFALIMGLGMLVDNGIVVVENVYRLMEEEGMSRMEAAKKGIGEIAFPIIISTLTTVAAFVPLGLWPGIMGQFMIYFPITLSIVLGSSLFVAIFINSMLVSAYMETGDREISLKNLIKLSIILVVALLIFAFAGFGNSVANKRTKIEFFPDNKPNQIFVYIEYPQGTDIEKTNSITKAMEKRVAAIINDSQYIKDGSNVLVESTVAVGPPAGSPINIEIAGNNYDLLIQTAEKMVQFINSKNIAGIDELKIDVNKDKPSMQVIVDREKAGELGVSNGFVGNQLRRSVFGEKAGVYKLDGDNYDINVRFNKENRYDNNALFNQNITFRDQATGQLKEIPISAFATQKNSASYSAIKHKNAGRVVTVYSGLKPGFTDAGAIVSQIEEEMQSFTKPKGLKFDFTGQIEEQKKQQSFLMGAFFTGLGLIFFILIFQFSSISKPTIIMIAIFLSLIGVFGGLVATGAPFVIMMTMMGIISLAGIVVNNGVVLLDYTQLLIDRKTIKKGFPIGTLLPKEDVKEAIIEGGRARLRPVLLTAITTVLGLIPLAIGFNIDFFSLFATGDPKIYFGGDNVIFWGPLAKTVIYGLIVATFLTLVIVPVLFYLIHRFKLFLRSLIGKKSSSTKQPNSTLLLL